MTNTCNEKIEMAGILEIFDNVHIIVNVILPCRFKTSIHQADVNTFLKLLLLSRSDIMNNLIAGFGQGISINRSNDTRPEHEYLHCASRHILIFRLAQGSSGVPKSYPGHQNISKNTELYHN
jgi:hypothetical protein